MHSVVPPLAKLLWRPTVRGLDNIPLTGPVIFASNHLSFVDSVVIPVLVPRKVVFLAKSDYFDSPGVKGALSKAWFEGLGMLPVDREDTKAAMDSLDTALEVLGRGEAFGIYPEGTRSRDGRIYRGRTGVAHLALTAGCPVVPVGLRGTQNLQPVGARLPATRTLASSLGVARNTVLVALDRLALDGLIQCRRGSGCRVVATVPASNGRAGRWVISAADPRRRACSEINSSTSLVLCPIPDPTL